MKITKFAGHPPILSAAILLLLTLLPLFASCSHTSVRHLNRELWRTGRLQTLETKFWHFDFKTIPMQDQYEVKGQATLIPGHFPEWTDSIDELWLSVYLNDSLGRVMAKDLHVFPSMALRPEQGIPFEFVLEPEDIGSGDQLYITFGYRMVLSGQRPGEDKREIFFANEGAMTRF